MRVVIDITSVKGRTDGYMEVVLGSLMFAGFLRKRPELSTRDNGDGTTTITIEGDFNAPPLGHLGDEDLKRK